MGAGASMAENGLYGGETQMWVGEVLSLGLKYLQELRVHSVLTAFLPVHWKSWRKTTNRGAESTPDVRLWPLHAPPYKEPGGLQNANSRSAHWHHSRGQWRCPRLLRSLSPWLRTSLKTFPGQGRGNWSTSKANNWWLGTQRWLNPYLTIVLQKHLVTDLWRTAKNQIHTVKAS